MNLDICLVLSA